MSISQNFGNTRPSLLLDFANVGRLDPRVTFARASSATYFDQLGVLQSAANDTPRFDYNPSTLAAQGLLIEEQRTNSIRNNTMQGAAAGTPGTAPTNWVISTATGNLTSREIVGTGTENGINYIDVRFVTSGAFTASVYADSATGVAAANGQTWTSSFYTKVVGGSLANLTLRLSIVENDAGGNFLAGADSAVFVPTSAALNTQRQSQTRTNTNASTAFEWSRIKFEFSGAADITLRIGLPQLEQGAFATSVIPTTTTALTRSADAASMTGTNFSEWFNAAEGTVYSEFTSARPADSTTAYAWDIALDGSNYIAIRTAAGYTPDRIFPTTVVGGTGQFSGESTAGSGYLTLPISTVKNSLAYKVNDFANCWNGGSVLTDTSGTLPTPTTLYVGANFAQNAFLSGTIKKIAYYPQRLSNAQLQALTG